MKKTFILIAFILAGLYSFSQKRECYAVFLPKQDTIGLRYTEHFWNNNGQYVSGYYLYGPVYSRWFFRKAREKVIMSLEVSYWPDSGKVMVQIDNHFVDGRGKEYWLSAMSRSFDIAKMTKAEPKDLVMYSTKFKDKDEPFESIRLRYRPDNSNYLIWKRVTVDENALEIEFLENPFPN